jgi:hypothetical protein
VPGTADRLGEAGIDGKDIDQAREGKNPQLQVLKAARIRRRALARLRRAAAWSWLSPGLPAVSAPRCLDAAQEGAEAGGESLAAVAGPDVLAEGGQGGERPAGGDWKKACSWCLVAVSWTRCSLTIARCGIAR